ncbi:hypothetical protein [Aporhodopirellula aestuarii]|uniref:Uncharacterized protein n=1 Tax=Aporhodopirellula aestuarii TaxID=2950107 RepID=A0ABT0UGC5_9BACT|nr:hypothetical protein [Aporhodopirellula aestuarii]MCM2375173.1 hypothetical protein [Aporhodopirellula aestuarii]
MSKTIASVMALLLLINCSLPAVHGDDAGGEAEPSLAADLEAMQGSWELLHGQNAEKKPNTRSVKTITGNTETLRRYNLATGKLTHEHSVEFELSETGSVRALTFYTPGGTAENGFSYIYKIEGDVFYDIPGMLQGSRYRNYLQKPNVYRWIRLVEDGPRSPEANDAE